MWGSQATLWLFAECAEPCPLQDPRPGLPSLSLRPLCHDTVTQYLHRSGQTVNIADSQQHCYTAIKQQSHPTVDWSSSHQEDLWQNVLRRLGLGWDIWGHSVIQNQLTLIVLLCHQLGLFSDNLTKRVFFWQIEKWKWGIQPMNILPIPPLAWLTLAGIKWLVRGFSGWSTSEHQPKTRGLTSRYWTVWFCHD